MTIAQPSKKKKKAPPYRAPDTTLGPTRQVISVTKLDPPQTGYKVFAECGHWRIVPRARVSKRRVYCEECLDEQNAQPPADPKNVWHRRPNADPFCDICGARVSGVSVWHRAMTSDEAGDYGVPAYQKRVAAGVLWFK